MMAWAGGLPPVNFLSRAWPFVVGVLDVLLALLVSAHVILRKRDVRAAIGWIGLVWLAPIVGSLAYLVLADWDRLHEGPYLDAHAVRAVAPIDVARIEEPFQRTSQKTLFRRLGFSSDGQFLCCPHAYKKPSTQKGNFHKKPRTRSGAKFFY